MTHKSATLIHRCVHQLNAGAHQMLEALRRSVPCVPGQVRMLVSTARRQPRESNPVDLNGVLALRRDWFTHLLGGNTSLELKLEPGLWPICVNCKDLDIALAEVAVSARVALGGRGSLILETANVMLEHSHSGRHEDGTAGCYVLLAISGIGPRIAKDGMAREPFFTGTDMERLAQIDLFAKDAGGHMTVDEDSRRGTRIRIYLPRFAAADSLR